MRAIAQYMRTDAVWMPMPSLALALLALYAALAVGLRIAVALRRTGATGFNGLRRGANGTERLLGALFAVSVLLCVLGPILQLVGIITPLDALDGSWCHLIGAALTLIGIATTLTAQLAMGESWRIGVDLSERTELVTDGPFSAVRNPIFAAMIPTFVGIALLSVNVITIAGATLLIVALELHTRLIEEPYLLGAHGERYARYAARVGRFLPQVGRLPLD
jgi:protein-S-isoprenylcysteine O-methyltransferase Ste14